jgi:beta-carotene ketolase (CrtW type)
VAGGVVLLLTLLYTGLFITAHDSMHGVVVPRNRKLNDLFGRLAVTLYALFSFEKLCGEHARHHNAPVTDDDPDFHDGSYLAWYLNFLWHYVTPLQLVKMAALFQILLFSGVQLERLLLYFVAPSLLSTVQLFTFGTYLPHRRADAPFLDNHQARSNHYSTLWSFLTCYHFGYHHEHHLYPYVPWWKLPEVHKEMQAQRAAE